MLAAAMIVGNLGRIWVSLLSSCETGQRKAAAKANGSRMKDRAYVGCLWTRGNACDSRYWGGGEGGRAGLRSHVYLLLFRPLLESVMQQAR
jgi:hypothetical protein